MRSPGTRFLLGFSGGLDSVYLAWWLLEMGYKLHMFFVEYRTAQRRYLKEIEAHKQALEWFKARGLTDWIIQYMTAKYTSPEISIFTAIRRGWRFWPRRIHHGWYELPDGRRIRGKEAALAALRGEA